MSDLPTILTMPVAEFVPPLDAKSDSDELTVTRGEMDRLRARFSELSTQNSELTARVAELTAEIAELRGGIKKQCDFAERHGSW